MMENDWFKKFGISDALADEIVQTGRALWDRAEPGFLEKDTHEYLSGRFRELGFAIQEFTGIPGFIAMATEAVGRARIALIADMDALPDPGSVEGAYIHSCGHHMQMCNLYGAARILKESGSASLSELAFIAVPAEEYIDFDKRTPLRKAGTISRLSGKQELLARDLFKPFEKIVSTHGAGFSDPLYISSVRRMSGFDVLHFVFKGRSSHAGAAPHKGINAQNAASLFLQACAFLRESFRESDHIRIHPVLKLPEGQSVNIIPDTAFVETYVRASDVTAIKITIDKLKAAAEGCAKAIGASVEIEVVPGYAPFIVDEMMHDSLRKTVEELGIPFIDEDYASASSDMGDVSQALPSVMLGLPGANGLFHNPGFLITDEKAAFVLPSVVAARYLEKLISVRTQA